MRKKLFLGFGPLLVLGVFLVAPVGAQAVENPHWFSGGLGAVARIPEAEKVQVIGYGTLSLTNVKTGGKVECHNVASGTVENPGTGAEGPAGVGETQSFDPFDCESAACLPGAPGGPATYISVGAETVGVPFPKTGTATNLKWPSHLLIEGLLVRAESENIKINVNCHVNTGFNGKGEAEFGVEVHEISTGSNKPSLVTKCCKATAPPETEFDAGSGFLLNEKGDKGKTEGVLKTLGYNEEEVINAKKG